MEVLALHLPAIFLELLEEALRILLTHGAFGYLAVLAHGLATRISLPLAVPRLPLCLGRFGLFSPLTFLTLALWVWLSLLALLACLALLILLPLLARLLLLALLCPRILSLLSLVPFIPPG